MTYEDFKNTIHAKLRKRRRGMTWRELKESLALPYDRPCPEWTRRLEREIGLVREKGPANALLWSCKTEAGSDNS